MLSERDEALSCLQARAFEATNGGKSVFRNEYTYDLNPSRRAQDIGGSKGVKTATFKVVSWKSAGGAAAATKRPGVPDPILRSVNAQINGQLDETTRAVVRFVEAHRSVKVAKLVLEYVLDAETDEPYLLHASECRVVLLDAKESLVLKKKKKQRSYKNEPRNARERKKLARQIQLAEAQTQMSVDPHQAKLKQSASSRADQFPSPFKCCGDFCDQNIGSLDPVSMLTPHERMLFQGSASEEQLKTQLATSVEASSTKTPTAAAMGRLEDLGASKEKSAWRQIAWRSIHQSRQEARPGAKSAIAGNNSEASADVNERFMRGTLSNAAQKTWSRRHGSVAGGASNYYREVNVCQACHVVYSILDGVRKLAREKKERQQQSSFKATAATSGMDTGGLGWTLDDDVAVRPSTSHAIREKRRALLEAMGAVQDDGVGIDTSFSTLEAGKKKQKRGSPSGGKGASPRSPGGARSPKSPRSPTGAASSFLDGGGGAGSALDPGGGGGGRLALARRSTKFGRRRRKRRETCSASSCAKPTASASASTFPSWTRFSARTTTWRPTWRQRGGGGETTERRRTQRAGSAPRWRCSIALGARGASGARRTRTAPRSSSPTAMR